MGVFIELLKQAKIDNVVIVILSVVCAALFLVVVWLLKHQWDTRNAITDAKDKAHEEDIEKLFVMITELGEKFTKLSMAIKSNNYLLGIMMLEHKKNHQDTILDQSDHLNKKRSEP